MYINFSLIYFPNACWLIWIVLLLNFSSIKEHLSLIINEIESGVYLKRFILEIQFVWKKKKKDEQERFQDLSKVVQRSSKVFKSSLNASQGLAFIDSSCLVKKTIGKVITLRKSCQVLHLLTFYSKLVTGNRLP